MREMGQSWGAPGAATQAGHGLVKATTAFLARPAPSPGGDGEGPAPSLPTAPSQGPRVPCLPLPCRPSPGLRLPGSRSLPLAVFRALPLHSPSPRPIYSSGLFLGQEPGAGDRGPWGAAGTVSQAPQAARLPVSPPRCWRMGLCRAPGTWRLSHRAVAGLRGAQQSSVGLRSSPWGSARLHGAQQGSVGLFGVLWGSVGLGRSPWGSARLHGFHGALWASMELSRAPWVSMGLSRLPWVSAKLRGSLWGSAGLCGAQQGSVGLNGAP